MKKTNPLTIGLNWIGACALLVPLSAEAGEEVEVPLQNVPELPGFKSTYIEASHSASGKVMQYEFEGMLGNEKIDIEVAADGRRIVVADK